MIVVVLFRLLAVLVIFRALTLVGRGLRDGLHPPKPKEPAAVPLARDPICGTFVVPGRALSETAGGVAQYFCSEHCRRAWVSR
jgi:YHS domain-containing protein